LDAVNEKHPDVSQGHPLGPMPGEMVGEYQVESRLGEGGMGDVFQGLHPVIGKRVAIKVLKPAFGGSEEMVQRFISEAASVNKICHPNIVDVFAFGQLDDGRHYFVMEFLDGESFEAWLQRERHIALADLLPVLRQVADALDAAHAAGVIHRDLKPDNIHLVTDHKGRRLAKVVDFGIAKFASGGSHRTQTGLVMGTPHFMSPEQCRGQSVDHRTDVYSFGVLTYVALTGRYPFEADSIDALLCQHLSAVPTMPSEQGAPVELDPILVKTLAKRPEDRYPSLGAVVEDLALVSGIELPDDDSQPSARPAPPPATGPPVVSSACTTMVGALSPAQAPEPPVEPAPATASEASNTDTEEWLSRGGTRHLSGHRSKVHTVAFSHDSKLLASSSDDGSVRVWDRLGREENVVTGKVGVEHLLFSPDGALLAAGCVDGTVKLWRFREGSLRELRGHKKDISGLTFTSDGRYVFSASRDGTLRMWDVETGDAQVLKGHIGVVRAVAHAPDEACIASAGYDRTVRVWEDLSGRRTVLEGHTGAVHVLAFRPDGRQLASAGADATIHVWPLPVSPDKPVTPRVINERKGLIRSIEYSPDGRVLASAGADGNVRLWRLRASLPVVLEGHEGPVYHVTFSPSGGFLASSSLDGTVRLWDVARRRSEMIISHEKPATFASFSPDGSLLASCGGAPTVLLTAVPRPEKPQAAPEPRARASRPKRPQPRDQPGRVAVLAALAALLALLVVAALLGASF
jgi:WD40 repeat protein